LTSALFIVDFSH